LDAHGWTAFPQVRALQAKYGGLSPQLAEQALHTLVGVFHTRVPVIHRDLWTWGLGFVGDPL